MPTAPRHHLLGELHVDVPGTRDQVNGVDALGAKGERRNRLRTTDPVDGIDPEQPTGREHRRRDVTRVFVFAPGGRRVRDADHAGVDAGYERGHGQHDQRREQHRCATRDGQSRARDRRVPQAQLRAIEGQRGDRYRQDVLLIGANVRDGSDQRLAQVGLEPGLGDVELLLGDPKRGLLEARIRPLAHGVDYGVVSADTNVFDDRGNL